MIHHCSKFHLIWLRNEGIKGFFRAPEEELIKRNVQMILLFIKTFLII